MVLSGVVTTALDAFRGITTSLGWGSLVSFSRAKILSLLSRIERGTLVVQENGSVHTICGSSSSGSKPDGPKVELTVWKESFWVRLLLFADMGFAESYMLGEVSCLNLSAFFKLFIINRHQLSNATTLSSSLFTTINGLLRRTNTMSNALLNVSAHYDISNEMFAAFLSDDMTYSCPIWLCGSRDTVTEESLQDAQHRKLQRFIDNAHIKPTDHVLEIGTGWGSFAILAVKMTGCRVTSLTLSQEQKELAEKSIAAAGYTDEIEILLCDYRALPIPREGPYDKVVSIEMLEAVGKEYLSIYFDCVEKLLKPDGGIAVFQCITMPEARYEGYAKGEDFIRKYIFPGGHLPTVSHLVEAINKGSGGKLIVESIESIGGHYTKTLRLWNDKFQLNFDSRIRPALLEEHKGMTDRDVDLFRRKWEYYFAYCEAGFNTKTLGDVIITVGREGAMELLEDIPL